MIIIIIIIIIIIMIIIIIIIWIIFGYGNDKLHDCALSISYLRRHPYILLPHNNNELLCMIS